MWAFVTWTMTQLKDKINGDAEFKAVYIKIVFAWEGFANQEYELRISSGSGKNTTAFPALPEIYKKYTVYIDMEEKQAMISEKVLGNLWPCKLYLDETGKQIPKAKKTWVMHNGEKVSNVVM